MGKLFTSNPLVTGLFDSIRLNLTKLPLAIAQENTDNAIGELVLTRRERSEKLSMKIYFPFTETEKVEVFSNGKKLNFHREGDWLYLPHILPTQSFTFYHSGKALFKSSIKILQKLEHQTKLVKGTLCRDVWVRHEELHPKSPTTVFYRNDQQVVLFTELLGIQNDCPVIVTLYREEELFYGTLASIPASEDPDRQFRRTYATAIFLSPDVQPGKWTVGMYLLTGKELYRSYFHISPYNRVGYGTTSENLLSEGRIFDEYVK